MPRDFRGIFAILPTPFDAQRRVDIASLRSLTEFFVNVGVNGIVILGILSEVHRLSESERQRVSKVVVEQVRGRVPIVSGTGAPGTDLAIMYSRRAEAVGVDALLIAPPRLLMPNDEIIFRYYSELASRVRLPIVVQDEPLTYGVHFSPALIAQLSEVDLIQYLKLEDAPTLPKISQIRQLIGDKLGIFGGLGGLYFYEELSRGACGTMTGFAYPELLVTIYQEFMKGNRTKARTLFYQALPLIRYEAQPIVNLAIRKEILKRRGVIKNPTIREPGPKLDSGTLQEIHEITSILAHR